MPGSRRISLPHLLLLVPWVAVVGKTLGPITDNSYLWHITAGHLQRAGGVVLTSDPFSFTMAGEPWLTQSWLAELLYGIAHNAWGIGFTVPMVILAAAIAVIGAGLIVFRSTKSVPTTSLLVALSSLMLLSFLVPRPVLFSYPLFVLVVLAWDRPSLRWTLPFLMWTWASVHGSFIIGLGYLGLMMIHKKEWRASPVLVVSGLVTLLTAHGLGVLTILTEFLTARPYLALMSEWQSPNFLSADLFPFVLGAAILVYGAVNRRLVPPDLWIVMPFLLLALSASRSVAIAWIALLPIMARSLGKLKWNRGSGFPVPVAAVAGVIILALPLLLGSRIELDSERFPIAASEALDDVRTFHDDTMGGYLIYAETFTEGVFIDDRAELYRDRIREFVDVRAIREPWEPVFARDGIQQTLLRVGEPLVGSLRDAGWEPVFEDANFIILRPS